MIDPEIFPDNDVDLRLNDVPAGMVVQWFIGVLDVNSELTHESTAIHSDLSGTLSEGTDTGGAAVYTGVVEGSAITEHLYPDYVNTLIGIAFYSGQDFRVFGTTTPRSAKKV